MIIYAEPDSLFDTRGGSLMAHYCEVCTDPLPEGSRLSTCTGCADAHEEDE